MGVASYNAVVRTATYLSESIHLDMIRDEQGRALAELVIANLDHRHAGLHNVNGRVEDLGQRQDLRLAAPRSGRLHGVAVRQVLALGIRSRAADALARYTDSLLVVVRDERHKFVRVLPHVVGCCLAQHGIRVQLRCGVSRIHLVSNGIVEAMPVRCDLVQFHLQLVTEALHDLAFHGAMVHGRVLEVLPLDLRAN